MPLTWRVRSKTSLRSVVPRLRIRSFCFPWDIQSAMDIGSVILLSPNAVTTSTRWPCVASTSNSALIKSIIIFSRSNFGPVARWPPVVLVPQTSSTTARCMGYTHCYLPMVALLHESLRWILFPRSAPLIRLGATANRGNHLLWRPRPACEMNN